MSDIANINQVCKERDEALETARQYSRQIEKVKDEARESKDRISKRAEAIRCELVESEKLLASEKATRNAIIAKGVEMEKELAEAKAYANKCRDGCIALSHSIDRIDYLCGEPNEMGVSDYCVHQDDAAVVERVRSELEAMREAIGAAQTELSKITAACHGALDGARLEGSASVEYSQGFASVKSMASAALSRIAAITADPRTRCLAYLKTKGTI